VDLAVVGPAFSPAGGGLPFSAFAADRAAMHEYLYNGDDLWPKTVNLCARGRSALLDLDLGPGAARELGLFGPAWRSQLHAVAVSRDPDRPLDAAARTRLLLSWPVVSTGETGLLARVHALGAALVAWPPSSPDPLPGPRGAWDEIHLADLLELQHPDLLPALVRPRHAPAVARDRLRAVALGWLRRLKAALIERLAFPAGALGVAPGGAELLPFDRRAGEGIRSLGAALETAAAGRGLRFDADRYRAFWHGTLRGTITGAGGPIRASADQLRGIAAALESERRAFDARHGEGAFRAAGHAGPGVGPGSALPLTRFRAAGRRARQLAEVERELARLDHLVRGTVGPGWAAAVAHHGAASLLADRGRYLELESALRIDRQHLARAAQGMATPDVRARMGGALPGSRAVLAVASYYYDTEHLMETTSGYTHVGIVKRLPVPGARATTLWMIDNVLGFHYIYPVEELRNSTPVQALVLSDRVAYRPRAYRWVRFRVPRVLDLGGGVRSSSTSVINLLIHLKGRLAACPALRVTPGFYYAAFTWLVNHPLNRLVLGDLWDAATHTGYGYRTLATDRLPRLAGRTLHVPVEEVIGAAWGPGCPARLPGPYQGVPAVR
jgi:hypothetical protein